MDKADNQLPHSVRLERQLRNSGMASQFICLLLISAGYFAFTNQIYWERVAAIPLTFIGLTPVFAAIMSRVAYGSFNQLRTILDNPDARPSDAASNLQLLRKLTNAPWLIGIGSSCVWLLCAPASVYLIEQNTPGPRHGYIPLLLAVAACVPAIFIGQVLRIELLARPFIAQARIGQFSDLAKLPLALTIRKRLLLSIGILCPYLTTVFAVFAYIQISSSATIPEALQKVFSLQLFFISAMAGLSALFVYYLMRVVNQPLDQIKQALSNNATAGGASHQIASAMDEFGVVARLVVERNELEIAKQEFFAMVGHEVRSPIMSIKTFLGLLSEGAYGNLPERVQKKATTAEQNAARLVRLINNILDAEKLQAGKFECVFKPGDSASIVDRAVKSVSELAEREGIEVIVECTREALICDEERMVQVLVNFLSNAIKNADGKPVRVRSFARAADLIEFGVQDQGAGIPVDLQQQVFEKFKQLANARESGMKGTGIGLPIAKALVEQHGGAIGVESEPDTGSYFWARIPRQHAQDILSKFQTG